MITSLPLPRALRASTAVRTILAGLALALVAVTALTATPAHAEDTVGVSARPADAAGNADARTRFSYQLDPGQTVDDHFLVQNTGNTTQTFTVVGTDAFNDADGAYALLPTDEAPTDVGAWVTFENGANRIEFTLAPGEQRVLPFRLQLPADATPGDHAGGLVASVVTPGEQVTLDRRVATAVYTRVSGQLQPRLAVAGIEAVYLGDWWNPLAGTVRLTHIVDNPGNIALASNVSVGVKTWFGIPASDNVGDSVPELLPGNSHTYETEVPAVAAWLYLNPWVTLNPFVDDEPSMQLPVSPTSRDTVLIAPPWILLIAIALIAGFVLFRRWRRKVDAKRAEEWIAYTEAEAKRKAAEEREVVGAGAGAEK